jgi:hypothetical protein
VFPPNSHHKSGIGIKIKRFARDLFQDFYGTTERIIAALIAAAITP